MTTYIHPDNPFFGGMEQIVLMLIIGGLIMMLAILIVIALVIKVVFTATLENQTTKSTTKTTLSTLRKPQTTRLLTIALNQVTRVMIYDSARVCRVDATRNDQCATNYHNSIDDCMHICSARMSIIEIACKRT